MLRLTNKRHHNFHWLFLDLSVSLSQKSTWAFYDFCHVQLIVLAMCTVGKIQQSCHRLWNFLAWRRWPPDIYDSIFGLVFYFGLVCDLYRSQMSRINREIFQLSEARMKIVSKFSLHATSNCTTFDFLQSPTAHLQWFIEIFL